MSAPRPSYAYLVGRLVRMTLSPAALRPWGTRRTLALLLFVPVFLAVQAIHWVGLLLDELLFPAYRDVVVREPVFVVGLPRSGTSYLQRILARDDGRFTTLRLWQLVLAPSITERRVWGALGRLDRWVGRPGRRLVRTAADAAFRFMDPVHPVDLEEPEEDYLFLLPAFACFLLAVPFPEHPAVWALARFDEMAARDRDRLMAFYRSCVQRHLYVEGRGRCLLSKNPSFTPMVRSLLRAFPDARLVLSLRDPREGVPSLLSSLSGGARAFGWDVRTPRFRDRFVDMLEHFAAHAVDTLDALPEERCAVVPLPALRADMASTVLECYRRFGWSADASFREGLEEESRRARAHRSPHRYALEEYGLSEEGLTERFDALLRRFDLTEPAPR